MTSRLHSLAFAFAGLLGLTAGSSIPLAVSQPVTPFRIEIGSTPISSFDRREPERRRFGALEFRGGLVLTSEHKRFGGFSGLRIAADGEWFLALTDRGFWLRGRILTDGNRPTGIADAEMAPVLGPNGRPLAERGWYDTEALAEHDGTLYVGIERVNRIVRFDYRRDGLLARGQEIPTPAGVRNLARNAGIEALAFVPEDMPLAGTLIAIAEQGAGTASDIPGFLIRGPRPGTFTLRYRDDYNVTDAAIAPGGRLLVLERHFSFFRGALMRIRRLELTDVRPGALVDGEVLIEASLAQEIDNMEAIAVHRNAGGETIITLLSDDNFNRLQRTILLRFALIER
jgi:hypothetical protein